MNHREKFFNLSMDMLCVANMDGSFVDVNAAFTRVLGYERDALLSRPYLELIHPDDVDRTLQELARLRSGAKTIQFENRYRHRDGRYLTLSWDSTPDTEAGLVYAIARDMTSEVETRDRLARILRILNETNSIAKVGGWELDVATGELEWTDETFRILEVEKRIDQKPMLPEGLKLFTEECQPIIERAVSRAIELGEPYSLELEARTAKGNVLWVYTNGQANYEGDQVVSLSGTIQDIHARKMAELRYEAERRRVLHDMKMASLGELAAAMAHELNNPLGIVTGHAEVALELPGLPEAAEAKLEGILRSCDRMSHIVRNLKRFSRSDGESQGKVPCSLREIIQDSINLVSPRLRREMVRCEVHVDSDVRIACVSIEIEQVLVNLLNNAVDAMADLDEKWISVALLERDDGVEVSVTDAGTGVDPDAMAEMFTPFFTTKASGEGTGLGLAISREILQDHGGALSYVGDSEHTCFRLTFPRLEEERP